MKGREYKQPIGQATPSIEELEAENQRLRDVLERCYKDLISGDFDPETSDMVRKLLEQSDE